MKSRVVSLFMVCVLLASLLAVPAAAVPAKGRDQLELLKEIDYYVTNFYVATTGSSYLPSVTAAQLDADPTLFSKIIDQMVGHLDKYTGFYTKERYEENYPMGNGGVGFGITAYSLPKGYYISNVLQGSAAEKAGLREGDMIVSVDGVDITQMFWTDAISIFYGPEGSVGVLKVVRPKEKGILTFSVTRAEYFVPHVFSSIENGVGIVTITQFGTDADVEDFQRVWAEFRAQKIQKVIFDLRGNPGGSVLVLRDMLDTFILKKDVKLFTMVESDGSYPIYSEGTGRWQPEKMVVLIDEDSASAAEMFSGTLKDNKLATVIGVPSYGKSRGQYHIDLSSGDWLVLTASRIVLPRTGDYEGVGITPDIVVELKPEPYQPPKSLAALFTEYPLFPRLTTSNRVLAVEQRLFELGFFYDVPDNIGDWYTLQCIVAFEKAYDLRVTEGYVGVQALVKLDELMKQLEKMSFILTDTQMEKAIEFLK